MQISIHISEASPRLGPVLKQSGELDARTAAAVRRGLLDAIGSLPELAQSLLRRRAAKWPQRDVRAPAATFQPQADKSASELQRSPHRSVKQAAAPRRSQRRVSCMGLAVKTFLPGRRFSLS
jgi:hypothetical protein